MALLTANVEHSILGKLVIVRDLPSFVLTFLWSFSYYSVGQLPSNVKFPKNSTTLMGNFQRERKGHTVQSAATRNLFLRQDPRL